MFKANKKAKHDLNLPVMTFNNVCSVLDTRGQWCDMNVC